LVQLKLEWLVSSKAVSPSSRFAFIGSVFKVRLADVDSDLVVFYKKLHEVKHAQTRQELPSPAA
jgi:hypothetical protein